MSAVCSVEGCHKRAKTRGWCSAHYERWRRNGVVGGPGDARKRPPTPCSANGCDYVGRVVRGLCPKHYQRLRSHGDADAEVRRYGVYVREQTQGYIAVYAPEHPMAMADGYALEHRMVAWDHGILTDPDDHVHHINHDKQDNRPENLEALSAAEHALRHATESGTITNQYGSFGLRSGLCSIEGCAKPAAARGWCNGHYIRWRRSGDPLGSATFREEAS